jgi:hypothetical protein
MHPRCSRRRSCAGLLALAHNKRVQFDFKQACVGEAGPFDGQMPFCELCEDVNNFSGKCLPAIAIREKKLSSSTPTGSRARCEIVPILSAA